MSGSFKAAKSIAKEKNKNLLIDTYASWCIPCKRMEKVFDRKQVGDFFNENYVTYRVNMDGPYGDEVKAEYQVVFLPTIIILGPDGEVKYKIDREMTSEELLKIGEIALQPGVKIASDVTGWRRNGELKPVPQTYTLPRKTKPNTASVQSKIQDPIPQQNDTKPELEEEANIVHVLGKGEVPPEILRQEAYFRLELMDGSHQSTAKTYLKTQDNWNTAENMKFILDFVNSTESEEYNHIIDNKESYYNTTSKTHVDNTLQILVYNQLYKGFPRPDLQKAIQLHKDLGYKNIEEYSDDQLIKVINLIQSKEAISDNVISLRSLQAQVYILANECKKARKLIKKTLKKADKLSGNKSDIENFEVSCDA